MKLARTSLALLLSTSALGAAPQADAAARASNAFGCNLYRVLAHEEGNFFFSPYSISVALAMTRTGARGETASQMDRVLHLSGLAPAASFRALAAALAPEQVQEGWGENAKRVPAYEFHVANALWGQEGLAFEAGFTRTLASAFGAPLERIDFRQSAKARARINAWVEKQTRERIRDIVPEGLPRPETRLALVNAIYLKAPWREPFEERSTAPGPFHTAQGQPVEAQFMHRVDRFGYAAVKGARIVELPYRGRRLSMVIVVPDEVSGLAEIEAGLSRQKIESWFSQLDPAKVSLRLPKFEFARSFDLGEVLPRMGMRAAFDPGAADFSGITRRIPLFIGAVLHKGFVAIDEKGTEAAAATVVLGEMGGIDAGKAIEVVVDRPFLFLIRHGGTVLFLGRVVDPTLR